MLKYYYKDVIILKRKIVLLLTILLITGCNTKPLQQKENKTKSNKIVEEEKNNYIDNNPIKLGMYLYTNSSTNRKLISEYYTNWILNVDLLSLEVYYTTDNEIPGTNQKQLWNNYYNNYQNIDNYRIGYKIEFIAEDQQISKIILSPQDTEEIYDYMQIYLYDDINQTSNWYDHIDKNEYTENTLLTSIKLTGSTKTDKITSDITLIVFTYDDDDFDENNEYRGISKYTTIIKRS